jgi:hypothetical protein
VQVERDFESEATVVAWTDADPGSDPRAACVEVAAAGDAEQRRLEAGCESDCEQLLWICSGPVVTPERYRDRKIDFEATVTRAAVALAAAFNDGLGGVEQLFQLR